VLPDIVLEDSQSVSSRASTAAQASAYQTSSLLLAGTALDATSRSLRALPSLRPSPALLTALLSPAAAAAALSATLSFTLRAAALRSRLGSNTYKRLNLALLSSSALQLLSFWLSITTPGAVQLRNSFAMVHLYAVVVSGNGFLKGVRGLVPQPHPAPLLADLKQELLQGVRTTAGFLNPRKPGQLPYVAAALLSLLSLLHDASLVRSGAAPLLRRLPSLSSSLLFFGASVSLSDAIRRDHPLNSLTFVSLNYALLFAGAAVARAARATAGGPGGARGAVAAVAGAVAIESGYLGFSRRKNVKTQD
jgi:hypothetical protein